MSVHPKETKKLLTPQEQIRFLKSKGIRFEIMDEEAAEEYLKHDTYFFRLKSYLKTYRKNTEGKYTGLDFAYLVELLELDEQLRDILLKMCLAIERKVKADFMWKITEDPAEDGFSIIQKLFESYPSIKSQFMRQSSSASNDLRAHYDIKEMPVWIFCEICTLDSFLKLFAIYHADGKNKEAAYFLSLLYSVKYLRNAAAHNNCLLNSLLVSYKQKNKEFRPVEKLKSEIKSLNAVSRKSADKFLKNHFIHDFLAVLVLLQKLCSGKKIYGSLMGDLSFLLKVMMIRHKEYFITEYTITSAYRMVVKIFDALVEKR